MAKIAKKKPAVKAKKLTPEERYWGKVNERAYYLITKQILNEIPFDSELTFELILATDYRYQETITKVQEYYSDQELPENPHELGETIFCEYMSKLIVDLQTNLDSWN